MRVMGGEKERHKDTMCFERQAGEFVIVIKLENGV